jgi:hypothetical protein
MSLISSPSALNSSESSFSTPVPGSMTLSKADLATIEANRRFFLLRNGLVFEMSCLRAKTDKQDLASLEAAYTKLAKCKTESEFNTFCRTEWDPLKQKIENPFSYGAVASATTAAATSDSSSLNSNPCQ